ncbi:hypothetical protein AKO1_012114, partial [Acrasis kona]
AGTIQPQKKTKNNQGDAIPLHRGGSSKSVKDEMGGNNSQAQVGSASTSGGGEAAAKDAETKRYTETIISESDNIEDEDKQPYMRLLTTNGIRTLKQWRLLSADKKTKYPDVLVEVLDKAAGLVDTSNYITVNTSDYITATTLQPTRVSSMDFKGELCDRDDAVQVIQGAALMNYQQFESNKEGGTEKQKTKVVLAVGSSGSGKTRACAEVTRVMRGMGGVYSQTQEIFMDFSNGSKINTFDGDGDEIIGARLFALVLRNEPILNFQTGLGNNFIRLRSSLRVGNVMPLIANFYREKLGLKKQDTVSVVIVLDEIQKVLEEGGSDVFRQVKHALLQYSCNNTHRNPNLIRDNVFITVVYSGTVMLSDVKFAATDYSSECMPLPPLSFESARRILVLEGAGSVILNHRWLVRYSTLMGLVPRNLRIFFDESKGLLDTKYKDMATEYDNQSYRQDEFASEVISKTDEAIKGMFKAKQTYSDSGEHDKQLIEYALSGLQLPDQEWVTNLVRSGMLSGIESAKVLIPHTIFMELINTHVSYFKRLIPLMNSDVEWEGFEDLEANLLAIKINTLVKNSITEYNLEDLFNSPVYDEGRAKTMISLRKVTVGRSKEFFIKKKESGSKDAKRKIEIEQVNVGPKDAITVDDKPVADRKNHVLFFKRSEIGLDAYMEFDPSDDSKKPISVFVQYKSKQITAKSTQQTSEMPAPWYDRVHGALVEKYKDNDCYFVYVTMADLTHRQITDVLFTEPPRNNLMIVAAKHLAENRPNIRPFYRLDFSKKK